MAKYLSYTKVEVESLRRSKLNQVFIQLQEYTLEREKLLQTYVSKLKSAVAGEVIQEIEGKLDNIEIYINPSKESDTEDIDEDCNIENEVCPQLVNNSKYEMCPLLLQQISTQIEG